MTGNEAIARGALEAGLCMAAGYPGTPSSEILENLASVAKPSGIYEAFSLPIMIRSVTRLSHGQSKVRIGSVTRLKRQPYFDRHDEVQDRWFCCAFNHLVKHRHGHNRDPARNRRCYGAGALHDAGVGP